MKQQFGSDNYSGICPQAMEYLIKANSGHDIPYGEDQWTKEAKNLFRQLFETDCEVFFVFNGTAANALAIATICHSYHSVICHQLAHIANDECGAPLFFSGGIKLLTANDPLGKLTPTSVADLATFRQDIHHQLARAVSLTQATEIGTIYTQDELLAIDAVAKKHGLWLHMDGARFANAIATLGLQPKQITWQAGIDVLCFGGTKNGLAVSDALIFFNKQLAKEFAYRRKQTGQLASKMRFLSAPWIGLLRDNIWLKNAQHANNCAAILEEKLRLIPGVEILFPRQANAVFVKLPPKAIEYLKQKDWRFYSLAGVGDSRLMCSWDTKPESIENFITDVKTAIR